MKCSNKFLKGWLGVTAALVMATLSAAAEPLFFAFDNGVGGTPVQQATMLKELGYAGIGYTGTNHLAERQRAFADAGLVITSLYVACKIGSPPTCDAGLLESLPLLKDRGIALWLTVHGQGDDDAAAAAVRLVAEPAAKAGVPVVLYPHHGFRVATAEQALPIVEKIAPLLTTVKAYVAFTDRDNLPKSSPLQIIAYEDFIAGQSHEAQ